MSLAASRPSTTARRSASPTHSPTNPYANLDPNIHPIAATLNSVSAPSASVDQSGSHTHRSLSPHESNRLTDFAQHVLGETGAQGDAENLLAFTGGTGDELFQAGDGSQFEGLLQEAAAEETANNASAEGVVGGNGYAVTGDVIPVDEATGLQQEGGNSHQDRPGRKRKRDGEEAALDENGEHMDPIRLKKDSHVSGLLDSHIDASIPFVTLVPLTLCRKRSSDADARTSTTESWRLLVMCLEAQTRWEKAPSSVGRQSISPR